MLCRESQILRLERLERFVRVVKGLFVLSLVLVAVWFIFVRYVSASTSDGQRAGNTSRTGSNGNPHPPAPDAAAFAVTARAPAQVAVAL